jgi:hypothetical protein
MNEGMNGNSTPSPGKPRALAWLSPLGVGLHLGPVLRALGEAAPPTWFS